MTGEKDIKKVLAANVLALLGMKAGDRGATAALIASGVSNGTATRVLKGKTSIGLDQLVTLADKLGVQPWQLCVPDLDPDRMPTIEPATFRWPFRRVDADVVTGLAGTAARDVEMGLLVALGTLGIAPRRATQPLPRKRASNGT